MMSGTSVAIALGDALTAECIARCAPPDVADDLAKRVDDLIVYIMRHGSSLPEKEALKAMCAEVADTMAIAIGLGWEAANGQKGGHHVHTS